MTSLPDVGRARREARDDGGETWHVDERVAARLVDLGAHGVGGFALVDGALVRAHAVTLAQALDGRRAFTWRDAIEVVAAIADAAATCERAALFPGPIEPDTVTEAGALRADPLVAALCGASRGAEARVRWLAPEQAAGAPPDNASNRYALGLILYRLLAGEHPFAGRGLRLGLDDQAGRGAPPLADTIAAELPPGLQSLCLRLLDPDPARRPAAAAVIARELRGFATATATATAAATVPATVTVTATATATATATVTATGTARSLLPIVAGVVIAACVIVTSHHTAAPPPTTLPAPALRQARALSDCASCHARESAEWSRSVMAHAVGSPLFESLEMLVEEQVGRRECPDGAGILRRGGDGACTDPRTGLAITGSGGAGWCVNCHAPGENLGATLPAWSNLDPTSRRPLRDLLPTATQEGVSCVACHDATGPARPGDLYQGNPSWTSARTGLTFSSRPEDASGKFGIANSGYHLDPRALIGAAPHRHADDAQTKYLRSSEMCGACHDVRLFGSDAVRLEPFKRLRNAYSEWATWADGERRAGRTPASCQDCHMSLYPGVCAPSAGAPASRDCPEGTAFAPRVAGTYPEHATTHYFTGVDVPLARDFDPAAIDDLATDVNGVPLGARERRDLLLARALTLSIDPGGRAQGKLAIPIVVENVGAGHRVPAGFSQEREIWIHLTVKDATGATVYEVGRVDRGDEDLHDKVFLHVNATDELGDGRGMFGADVADGRDVPRWDPSPALGGATFHGQGLVNFQNGFLRCVRCIGTIDERGQCEAAPGQGATRADRFEDGDYVPETGECRSNLIGRDAFLETYFPVGALDATRGEAKAPDAIIDTRSLPPGQPVRYVYDLDVPAARGPFTVTATLEFRAFPPYLLRAFIAYEAAQAARGLRPSGPLIDASALDRLDIVDLATVTGKIP